MKEEQQDQSTWDRQARRRADRILKVRRGELSAKDAAAQLGISRKTYYEWESRALEGMLQGLQDREAGRPSVPVDPEKRGLQERIVELEKELHQAKLRLTTERLLQLLPEARTETEETTDSSQSRFKKKKKRKRRSSNT